MNCFQILQIITSLATLLALGFTIYQSILTKQTLKATKKSIDSARLGLEEDKKVRQLSVLPEMDQIIRVNLSFEKWIEYLLNIQDEIRSCILNKDDGGLEKISDESPKKANSTITYIHGVDDLDEFPDYLRIIFLSGSQYYWNSACAIQYVVDTNGVNFRYAKTISEERIQDSIDALSKLHKLTKNMVPVVLLETPASMSNSEFFRK